MTKPETICTRFLWMLALLLGVMICSRVMAVYGSPRGDRSNEEMSNSGAEVETLLLDSKLPPLFK